MFLLNMIKTGDLTTSMVQTAIQCLHSEEILLYFQSVIQSKINSKYNMLNVVGCAAEVKIYFFIPETSSPLLIKTFRRTTKVYKVTKELENMIPGLVVNHLMFRSSSVYTHGVIHMQSEKLLDFFSLKSHMDIFMSYRLQDNYYVVHSPWRTYVLPYCTAAVVKRYIEFKNNLKHGCLKMES